MTEREATVLRELMEWNLRRSALSREERDDLIQDAFVKILAYHVRHPELVWAPATLALRAIQWARGDLLRQVKKKPLWLEEQTTATGRPLDPLVPDMSEAVIEKQYGEQVCQELLGMATPSQWKAIEAYYFQGLTLQEIAKQWNMTHAAVHNRITVLLRKYRRKHQIAETRRPPGPMPGPVQFRRRRERLNQQRRRHGL